MDYKTFDHALRDVPDEIRFLEAKQVQEVVGSAGWRVFERVVRAEVSKRMTQLVHGPALTESQYAASVALIRGLELALSVPEAVQESARRAELNATVEVGNGSV